MAGRSEGYYGPSPDDLGRGALALLALGVAGVVLVAALCAMSVADDGAAQAGACASLCGCCDDERGSDET